MTPEPPGDRPQRPDAGNGACKRLLDCLLSGAGLVLLSPVLFAVALAVRVTMGSPVLFRHRRAGKDGRTFVMYKFRTMTDARDADGKPLPDEARMTPTGTFLRRFSLDELPQLLNVLKGDMSLVGPRPEVPRYVEIFHADYEEILTVRPGITDLASIAYRDESAVLAQAGDPEQEYVRRVLPEKIALAKRYVRQQSLAADAAVILQTVTKLISDRIRPITGRLFRPVADGAEKPSCAVYGKE